MKKEISGETYECNAATPFVGKRIFKIDFLTFFEHLNDGTYEDGERIEILEKLAYTMKLMADHPLQEALSLTDEGFLLWLSGYTINDFLDTIIPQTVDLWAASNRTGSNQKNAQDPQ